MHETQDWIDVRFIDAAPSQVFVLVVIDAPRAISETLVTLEFQLQKPSKFPILETPEILTVLNLARCEILPEGALERVLELTSSHVWRGFDVKVRIEPRPQRD
jgi:hypothetical protein